MQAGDITYKSAEGTLYSGKLQHINDNPQSVYLGRAEILVQKQFINGEWLNLYEPVTIKNVPLENIRKITSVKTTYEIECDKI